MRLIDADKFEVVSGKVPEGYDVDSYLAGNKEILEMIDNAPTADADRVTRCNMSKAKYIEREPLLAWLENMGISEHIIKTIADEAKFPVKMIDDFDNTFYPQKGDDIYYVDIEYGQIEHGVVFSVTFEDGELCAFSVDFDNGDFDEFNGTAFETYFFLDADEAMDKIING